MIETIATWIGIILIAVAIYILIGAATGRWIKRGGHVREIKPGGILARLSKPVQHDLDDAYYLSHGQCPDCHAKESLLGGPSGGSAQNVACEWCLSEFNVAFIPGGPVILDRMGKLGVGRARIYGISVEEFDRAAERITA